VQAFVPTPPTRRELRARGERLTQPQPSRRQAAPASRRSRRPRRTVTGFRLAFAVAVAAPLCLGGYAVHTISDSAVLVTESAAVAPASGPPSTAAVRVANGGGAMAPGEQDLSGKPRRSSSDGSPSPSPDPSSASSSAASLLPSVSGAASSVARAKAPAPSSPAARSVAARPTAARQARGVTAAATDLSDIAYGSASSAQVLDLHLPQRTGDAVPLVVLIHGGAFVEGDKADQDDLVAPLVAAGYAVANINYRLTGEAAFPAGARDVKAAVRWLRAHAGTYGVDPNRFAAWGESAGGYMAAMLGTTGTAATVFDGASGDRSVTSTSVSSAVQAVVDWYGPTDFLTMDQQASAPGGCPGNPQVHAEASSPESSWLGSPLAEVASTVRTASPITYVAKARTLPPFSIVHGKVDCLVPMGQSQQLATALKKKGAKVSLTILDGAGHGGPEFSAQVDQTVSFLDRTFGRS
jgi:acetyl esterase/lipase